MECSDPCWVGRLLRPVAPAVAPAQSAVVNTTVFVRGVPREATTQSVETHFRIYGDIASCHVIRHKDASTNKGIAFVKFHDPAAAQRAILCNNPGVMDQREVFAEWAHPKPSATSASRSAPDQPPVFLPPPATFFPPPPLMPTITFPWIVTPGATSSYAPLPPLHVLGYPHPDNYTSHGQQLSLPRPPNYYPPVTDPGTTSAAAPVSADEDTPPQSFGAADEGNSSLQRAGKGKSI
jgi:RNA recognition motif-containing protein